MKTNTLGVVAIGQSPRPDIEAQLGMVLGPELRVVLVGALDGVSRAEIASFAPQGSHDTLYTRLPDGDEVIISKAEVTSRTQRHLDRFAAEGIDVVLMACTGEFRGLHPHGYVVFPSVVLANTVKSVKPTGKLGVFVPLPSQVEWVVDKWTSAGYRNVEAVALKPVEGNPDLERAAITMAHLEPDLAVMDCMGYTQRMKEQVRAITQIRAVLAISCAARAVQELLD